MSPFDAFAGPLRPRIERALARAVPDTPGSSLAQAMRYSLTGPGKRIRPLLVHASFRAVSSSRDHPALDAVACSVEAIHAYSLIHDDLPAMDDDRLRRGRPTCHIAFDEALAILAGDALQSLAFDLVANAPNLSDATRLKLVRTLSHAAGARGMVVGQAIDLAAVDQELDLTRLEQMHHCKTGALIDAAVELGAIAGGAGPRPREALALYSHSLGLAFQVRDDILDVTAETAILGKQQGADLARNKPTYVSLLGLEEAIDRTRDLGRQALEALDELPGDTAPLRDLAHYVVDRHY